MPIDDRCYLKTKPEDFFHAVSMCLPCDGYDRSCDRYTSNKIMDEIRNRDWQRRNRHSKALDDYVNEIVRMNGR